MASTRVRRAWVARFFSMADLPSGAVTFLFTDIEGSTRLVRRLRGRYAEADSAARNAADWENCLDRLAGLEPAPGAWQGRFERYTAAFEPAVGPQGRRPA